jgi:hypothetical protein
MSMITPWMSIGTCDACTFKGLVEQIGQMPSNEIWTDGQLPPEGVPPLVTLYACVTCNDKETRHENLNHQRLPEAEYAIDRK